jgi:hypothetical protein
MRVGPVHGVRAADVRASPATPEAAVHTPSILEGRLDLEEIVRQVPRLESDQLQPRGSDADGRAEDRAAATAGATA